MTLTPEQLVGALDVSISFGTNPREGLRLDHLYCTGALAARLTPDGLYLVSAGAHPVDDDRLSIDLTIGENCNLSVRSSGATLARAGTGPGTSRTDTCVRVGDDSTFSWLVEPGVAAARAIHVADSLVELASSARLCWRDEIVLGRHDDAELGSWRSDLRIRRSGEPLFVGSLACGPAFASWDASPVLAAARAVVSVVIVDPDTSQQRFQVTTLAIPTARAAALPLDGPAVELIAFGDDLESCRRLVNELLAGLSRSWVPTKLGAER